MSTGSAGRAALVTGGSRGIGQAIALRLAQDGIGVAVNYRGGAAGAADTVRRIEEAGGKAIALPGDVSNAADAAKLVADTVAHFGRLDILVNNAGITRDNLTMRMSEEDWDAVLTTNLKGAFLCSKAALRHLLKARDAGRIISISSVVGILGNAGQANYAAAKAGMIGLSKTIAKELGGKGITCNAIAPGFITTDMTHNLPQQVKDDLQKFIAVRRLGTPEDIAAAVEYVTSDDAGFRSGQCIVVDGGMTMA